ncbi:ketoacyl-ACP synthase III family protein [Burkholderia gladioli]|uniref:ketoacyl-ACP synthase III family protein n=1 Tax=Burkholderia gladioli TaxID=28095 RepID=UPI001641EBAB|nr:ketoacyl-ACP synthase III family protein [Burkholderia gladioli]
MKLSSLHIRSLGSYLPPRVTVDTAAEQGWYDRRSLEADGWLSACVAGDRSPPEMAVAAARAAIERVGGDTSDIDIVLHASIYPQGPHGWFPHSYVEHHTVARGVPSLDLRQGCTAVFAAFELLDAYLAVPGRHGALVTCADNFGFDPTSGPDPAGRWSYAMNTQTGRGSILGDAGAAVLLSNQKGFSQVLSLATRSLSSMEEIYRGGEPLFPPRYGRNAPVRLGPRFAAHEKDHPGALFSMLKRLNAARVEVALEAMDDAGIAPSQVERVVHVFAGQERYLEQFLPKLGIDTSRGIVEFGRTLGHLASCDPLVGLEHLVNTRQVSPGDYLLMMASGGAATAVSCAVLKISDIPSWLS